MKYHELSARLNRLHERQAAILADLRAVTLATPLAKVRLLKHEFERNDIKIRRLEAKLK